MERQYKAYKATAKVWVLCPKGDEIVEAYRDQARVLEGDKDDVLSRYVAAAKKEKADYIVRITADCVDIPSFMISRAIKTAVRKGCDYTTNVIFRTSMEGFDVEIISARLLKYLDERATGEDREHVTTLIRSNLDSFPFLRGGKPNVCHLIDTYDLAFIKTSIDTEEDYERTLKREEKMERKIKLANKFGFALKP